MTDEVTDIELSEEVSALEADGEVIHPAILVSYVYLEPFLKFKHRYHYRDWCMDSGAYSAWNSGKKIDIDKYVDTCLEIRSKDKTLSDIIALDVINDGKTSKMETAKQSLKNALHMKERGVEAIPVFHFGEDYGILAEYCAAFDKVGLSCRFGELVDDSIKFYDQCFARSWPKRFHSFGWMEDFVAVKWPFHSLDSASWRLQPSAFGYWRKFGRLSSRGAQDLRSQIKYYLSLEAKVQIRWEAQMSELSDSNAPTLRLATSGDTGSVRAFNHANLEDKNGEVLRLETVRTTSLRTGHRAVVPVCMKKSTDAKPLDNKWVDYWANRGLHRDSRADEQPNLKK